MVYAVEFSHRSGRDLINMAKKRTNVVPIIEDARHPHRYVEASREIARATADFSRVWKLEDFPVIQILREQ